MYCGMHVYEKLDGMSAWLLGFITLRELLQVRHIQDTPLILVGHMWPGLIEWARSSMLASDPPLANPEDMTIPRCAANADEAIAIIREHHGKWLNALKP